MPTTFEKTWQVDANRPHLGATNSVMDQTRSLAWYMKAFLTGQIGGATQGLWTVVGSSDGVTAALDGVDRWGSTYDGTKIVRGASGVAHSWIWLKSPNFTAGGIVNTPFYFCIDFGGITVDYQAHFTFGKAAPTGGSVTTRPSPSDEWFGASIQTNTNALATPKLNGWLATDGNFLFATANAGAGFNHFGLIFHVLADTRANDLYPVATFFGYNGSSPGAFAFVGAGNSVTSNNWQCRTRDGSAIHTGNMVWVRGDNVNPPVNFPNTGDFSDGTWIELPSYFLSFNWVQTTGSSIRGRFADIVAAAPGTAGNGSVEPIGGTATSQVLGYVWVPLTGVPVTL